MWIPSFAMCREASKETWYVLEYYSSAVFKRCVVHVSLWMIDSLPLGVVVVWHLCFALLGKDRGAIRNCDSRNAAICAPKLAATIRGRLMAKSVDFTRDMGSV